MGSVHRLLAAVVAAIAVIAFVGWRSLRSTADVRAAATPSPQLTPLIPYSQPLADTLGVVRVAPSRIALSRDPFGAAVLPPSSQISRSSEGGDVTPRETTVLHVTATMIGGSRRAAVINDSLIYVGDPVPGGGKLTSVERDRVVVTDQKGTSRVVAVKEGDT